MDIIYYISSPQQREHYIGNIGYRGRMIRRFEALTSSGSESAPLENKYIYSRIFNCYKNERMESGSEQNYFLSFLLNFNMSGAHWQRNFFDARGYHTVKCTSLPY